ncbi:hypothetical protein MLD38_021882 [Melastoma candidum]|uniref:Uncharacterized protein n=1 Tax=Melastoma candidum TaxID=119954 RepID=A0ACB9QHZ3_9MYRT|nr:hypothetical protein MLD38_021882 [Melastoma candidum]
MLESGIEPDRFTFACVIRACSDSFTVDGLGVVHAKSVANGFNGDAVCSSALVNAYSRLGLVAVAERVFQGVYVHDLVMCNSMINGYGFCGMGGDAFRLFNRMRSLGVSPDGYSFVGLVSGFTDSKYMLIGQGTHALCLRSGYVSHDHVAVHLSVCMLGLSSPTSQCETWERVRLNLDSEVIISSTLVDMYMKCGKWDTGLHVFKNMVEKNTVAYNSVISGLGLHGQASKAFVIFEEMLLDVRVRPDAGTFSALLSACYHAGLGKEVREVFRRMMDEFCIAPMTEHYVYMVKILGMEGELEVACNFVKALPVPVDPGIWGALLSCCEMHGDTIMADFVARQLYRIEPEKVAYQVMLSNIYAGNERWSDVMKLRDGIGVERSKTPGMSMVY